MLLIMQNDATKSILHFFFAEHYITSHFPSFTQSIHHTCALCGLFILLLYFKMNSNSH